MRKNLTLGLFGFGCVGQGLYQVLHQTRGIKATIKKICVRNPEKKRPLPIGLFTFDKHDILHDPNIDVVVELIDDADAAFDIVKEALQNGKHVVTANKKMLAEHLEEIFQLQQQHDRSVLYEGAVCGSIPIIRNLEEYYDNDLISGIEGIFNGSTNFILTKVFEERKNYAEALQQAQELGFAESNPDLDVKGFDPKFKLTIAILHAFGVFVKPQHIINIGIDSLQGVDLRYARENGYSIKLVAHAFRDGSTVHGFVLPQFVDQHSSLRGVRNEYNAVSVEGAFSEKQLFVGKGAGGFPTGSAVLSDISALTYAYRYEYKKLSQAIDLKFSNQINLDLFVRFGQETEISIHDFEEFYSGYASNGSRYMLGRASLSKLKEWSEIPNVSVILTQQSRSIQHQESEHAEQFSAA